MRDKIKLESTAGTGHFYTTTKNKRTMPGKMEIKKLVKEFSVAENMMLDRSHGEPFVKAGTLQLGALSEFAKGKIAEFDIRI